MASSAGSATAFRYVLYTALSCTLLSCSAPMSTALQRQQSCSVYWTIFKVTTPLRYVFRTQQLRARVHRPAEVAINRWSTIFLLMLELVFEALWTAHADTWSRTTALYSEGAALRRVCTQSA